MPHQFARIDSLERELHIRQLQVQRLLQITQAINNNVAAEDLFGMYGAFLKNELQLKQMALFVRQRDNDEQWECTAQLGLKDGECAVDLSSHLSKYKQLGNLHDADHPFLRKFKVVVPVLHKERPIAFVFVGEFEEEDDMYERLQIITTITNVIAVAIENKRLFRRQLEQERLEADFELGAEVQKLLIPKKLPANDRYELSSIYKPQLGVGGDYFDFVEFEDGKLVFCIGDFSGKGIPAALLMANFEASFQSLVRNRPALTDFVYDLNSNVFRVTEGERFVTFFVAEYDRHNHKLEYVNAGHPPALLASEDGLQLLSKGTMVLGSFPELPVLESETIKVPEEALIVTYTDGLTDLQSPAGETFEEEMFFRFTRRHFHLSARQYNQRLLDQLEHFRAGTSFPDDLSILTCRIFAD
ncbi:MAG: PP2C family protein-serine/threonine phosphatase [Bacteroidota bacterium]